MNTHLMLKVPTLRGIFVVLLGAGLTACGGSGGPTAQAKDAKNDIVNSIPVEASKVSRKPISASYAGTATLAADHDSQVVAKTSGVLIKLNVEEGMLVQAGQLLAELDDTSARASVVQTEAQLHKSEAKFAVDEDAYKQQLVSKRDYDQDRYDVQVQRAANEVARLQLTYTRIVAPVSGVIAERSVKLGNLIQTNQALFRIVSMDPLQAVLNVPERQLGILKSAQVVQMEVDALAGKAFAGKILRISPVVDPASGTFRVTCEFHDASGLLRPGMFGRLEIVYDHRDEALTIPRSALIEEDGETAVFVAEPPSEKEIAAAIGTVGDKGKGDDKTPAKAAPALVAHRKLVKIGYADADKVEIRSGLDEGTRVITVGRNAVRDGTAVQVLNGDKDKVLAEKVAGAKG